LERSWTSFTESQRIDGLLIRGISDERNGGSAPLTLESRPVKVCAVWHL